MDMPSWREDKDKYLEGKRMNGVCDILSGMCLQDIQVEKTGGRLLGVSVWASADRVGMELLMWETPVNTLNLISSLFCASSQITWTKTLILLPKSPITERRQQSFVVKCWTLGSDFLGLH